jgi:lipoprotein NlpI
MQASVSAQETSQELQQTLADLGKRLRLDPKDAEAYQERGCVQFKLGRFQASVADFDKYLELRPERKARHWQRGISCYYAGLYDEGRKQFESYHDTDNSDVENAVWRCMCMAKAGGILKARQAMLKVGEDRRVPMRHVYDMFNGKLQPTDVLAAAQAGKPGKELLNHQLFYAHLYVGIFYDIEGDASQALQHLNKAADDYRIGHYMWDVARVHRDLLKKTLLDKKK